ncbi:nucleotidyl transferase AbiEii/AbiGii toxin family protein [Candidatus Woesearchaeota archaeon]|nr:nucleotidyl transferase AbiEii/AbiGii toxin family protein [Candidatus Woesearchaeota archaeon]
MDAKINIRKYVAEVKRNMNTGLSDEMIVKDLLLTLVLAEFEKIGGIFRKLIFKGGTLLSRNYLEYHRLSEDLDFVYVDSNELRKLTRNQRERGIKEFIDSFVPALKNVANNLELDFDTNRSNTKYCTILSGRVVYIFRLYYAENHFIKVEINFVEKIIHKPRTISIKVMTDFFDSRELMFVLGLRIKNFKVPSYPIEEIVLEKYRAVLTRPALKERDLFDLFMIPDSMDVDLDEIVEKIRCSSLIKKELRKLVADNLKLLERNEFFQSDESMADLAIVRYDYAKFENLKKQIKPLLIRICKQFLEKSSSN